MNNEFWHERWSSENTGFHLDQPNELLTAYWSTLDISLSARVLVPLCGKSLDMIWLSSLGHEVVGVELSRLAVERFFTENELPYEIELIDGLRLYRSTDSETKISIFESDFQSLTSLHLGTFDALYDRAAMIALPDDVRAAYLKWVHHLLSPTAQGLIVSLRYPQEERNGPPFSVASAQFDPYLPKHMKMLLLHSDDLLNDLIFINRFKVSSIFEDVYHLTPCRSQA